MPGYWKIAPKTFTASRFSGGSTITLMPKGSARVRITPTVCGWQFSSTKNAPAFDFARRFAIVIASAAAVPSSSSEALATGSPVRSATIV